MRAVRCQLTITQPKTATPEEGATEPLAYLKPQPSQQPPCEDETVAWSVTTRVGPMVGELVATRFWETGRGASARMPRRRRHPEHLHQAGEGAHGWVG